MLAIVGATATGKTALGEALAAALGGEVVCADSRQVFRELEIGTGKPNRAERASAAHHLFDALSLGEAPSAGWYGRAAAHTCSEILARGRQPILVGGSGLYLRALQQGLSEAPPRDPASRARLREVLAAEGVATLYERLVRIDAETAARLEPRDSQRIMRALEVFEASGQPLSWWHRRRAHPPLAATWRVVEITLAPRIVAERIARRTRWMLDEGLIEETERLVKAGHEPALCALRAIGYDETLGILSGRLDRAAAEARLNARTRQLAKRQRTWFRHQIEAVRVDGADDLRGQLATVLEAAGG